MDAVEWNELEEFLFARAMEHDSPQLFRLAGQYLISSRMIRPGVILVLRRVATARARARDETWTRVAHLLTERRRAELDLLLVPDAYLGRARLAWPGIGPTSQRAEALFRYPLGAVRSQAVSARFGSEVRTQVCFLVPVG
ncbi:hypothetical protein Vau01_099120 [Virgisporangium aurantiacum]|uniref:Uncharacterized protein n=1 Tax=Virgisporangium aurantiacum TaxID=175570 RepID=A0A8J4E5K2_9ACTN|nr:hypothetical protein [Virgisporangium aurantiacum]GIJ62396.1 hypothetical protein Vau01_099120 [Virgisporangium aurantiacum]